VSARSFAPAAVLVTGGGAGIGASLAAALHARGSKVVIAGRTREKLEAVAARHSGMEVEVVDVADPAQVYALAERVTARHPGLDALINNAGVQSLMDFTGRDRVAPELIGPEIAVNLTGLIHVTNAFLPLLKRQAAARLIHVGSGLGYVPLAAAPVYSATKAAVHSFTISLRWQLAKTSVQVVELIPPVVETELHRGQSRKPPRAMGLEAFVSSAMAGLDAGRDEIPVGLARVLRTASRIAPQMFLGIVNKQRG
jgi:uncharacterized oxidoreductase